MQTAMESALAFVRWHGFREFRHMNQNTVIWCVVAGVAVLGLVVWAAQRRRRRWF
jgi:hypothetical protein